MQGDHKRIGEAGQSEKREREKSCRKKKKKKRGIRPNERRSQLEGEIKIKEREKTSGGREDGQNGRGR